MKEVKSNSFVLRGCFRREPGEVPYTHRSSPEKYNAEIVSVDYLEGEKRQIVEQDYPVTCDSLNSFVEMTDYKTNSSAYLAPCQNLGDIRDVEAFLQGDKDLSVIRDRAKALLAAIDKMKGSGVSEVPKVEEKAPVEPVKEVSNNE